jgi:hypothetical protein
MLTTSFSGDFHLEIVRRFNIFKPGIQLNCNISTIILKGEAWMRGSSIGLKKFVITDRTEALRVLEDAHDKNMQSSSI